MKGKTVRKRFSSKVLAVALTSVMLSHGFAALAYAGDTLPYKGESAKGPNQPYQHGYTSMDILKWTPESDPYGDMLRSRVPLQKRIAPYAATQASPELSPETQMFALSGDYGNSFFDSYSYTNEFSQYLFNYWQYTDYYSYWHGTPTAGTPEERYDPTADWREKWFEFGILNIPNPGYTNAAHKNGVLSIACIFFSDNDRGPQTYTQMLVQDKNGEFPVAKKLVEMARYYGYDGYFFNQEEASKGVAPADISRYKQFMKYLRDQGLYVQWYDSTNNQTGKIQYQNEFNAVNSPFVKDAVYGQVSDSMFLNYWWNADKLTKSKAHAESLGLDPLETVFAGVEGGNGDFGRWKQKYDLRLNLDANGQPMNSIATLGADFTHNALDEEIGGTDENRRADDKYQWMTFIRDRAWWSGPNQDPSEAERNPNAPLSDVYASGANWDGIAAYITERSVIDGSNFQTSFNTGHGLEYYADGAVSNPKEWSNINIQDIPVTWQWWIDAAEGEQLSVDFDYGSKYEQGSRFSYKPVGAYEGGSSLVVNGKLASENFLRLYKTELDVNKNSKLSITYNKPSGNDSSVMSVGLIFKDKPEEVVKLELPKSGKRTKGWVEEKLNLKGYAGRTIAAMGLVFDNPKKKAIENYQINIGQIQLTDGSAAKPQAPAGLKIEKALTDTNEMTVSWNMEDYSKVKQYNLYVNGSYVGGIYDSVYYIKQLPARSGKLSLTAVGPDGTESKPAVIDFDLNKGVSGVKVNHTPDGAVQVSWNNPAKKAGAATLTLESEYSDRPFRAVVKAEQGATSAVFTGIPTQGDRYALTIALEGGQTVVHRGKLLDTIVEPYAKELVTVTGDTYTLALPAAKDWDRLYVYENGEPKSYEVTYYSKAEKTLPYIQRGRAKLKGLTLTPSAQDSTIKLVLQDYAGNQATTLLRGQTEQTAVEIKGGDALNTGAEAQLSAEAKGEGTLTYTWYADYGHGYFGPLGSGQTLRVPHVTAAMNGHKYKVVVTDEAGGRAEAETTLRVQS